MGHDSACPVRLDLPLPRTGAPPRADLAPPHRSPKRSTRRAGPARRLQARNRRGACGCGRRNPKLNLQLASRGNGQHVLEQSEVIVFQPDLAKIIGHFQHNAVVFLGRGAQRRKPKIVGVGAEHGAQMLLRRTPDSFCGSLLHFSPNSPFFGLLFTVAYRTLLKSCLAPSRATRRPLAVLKGDRSPKLQSFSNSIFKV